MFDDDAPVLPEVPDVTLLPEGDDKSDEDCPEEPSPELLEEPLVAAEADGEVFELPDEAPGATWADPLAEPIPEAEPEAEPPVLGPVELQAARLIAQVIGKSQFFIHCSFFECSILWPRQY
ncbi:hypothetical protein [Noviherbaspirillum massiliense]|uniref:hypothetical protein n=1 Tax=Noviherbaspirillum massiliense TaxID=1465823 RepID=UPI00037B1D26|nr:hypothetical protein [Noviherbaspirillum massiliense]